MKLQAGLYIVSTPIGNLGDITLRALETLKKSEIILCEDTRVTQKLLAKYNIQASLKIYNDKSEVKMRNSIKNLIEQGAVVSLVSDAGTPLISDPGYKLVRMLKEENLHVDVSPGVCSVIAALTMSGLPTNNFAFLGFVPKTREKTKKTFESLKTLDMTLVFFETAIRLLKTLKIAQEVFGDRKANISREITKLHQESHLLNLSKLVDLYSAQTIKGEIVLCISGSLKNNFIDESNVEKEILSLLMAGKSAKDVAQEIFAKYKGDLSRKLIYQTTNNVKKNLDGKYSK